MNLTLSKIGQGAGQERLIELTTSLAQGYRKEIRATKGKVRVIVEYAHVVWIMLVVLEHCPGFVAHNVRVQQAALDHRAMSLHTKTTRSRFGVQMRSVSQVFF